MSAVRSSIRSIVLALLQQNGVQGTATWVASTSLAHVAAEEFEGNSLCIRPALVGFSEPRRPGQDSFRRTHSRCAVSEYGRSLTTESSHDHLRPFILLPLVAEFASRPDGAGSFAYKPQTVDPAPALRTNPGADRSKSPFTFEELDPNFSPAKDGPARYG